MELETPEECCICFEDNRLLTRCKHSICCNCIRLIKICPLCRQLLYKPNSIEYEFKPILHNIEMKPLTIWVFIEANPYMIPEHVYEYNEENKTLKFKDGIYFEKTLRIYYDIPYYPYF